MKSKTIRRQPSLRAVQLQRILLLQLYILIHVQGTVNANLFGVTSRAAITVRGGERRSDYNDGGYDPREWPQQQQATPPSLDPRTGHLPTNKNNNQQKSRNNDPLDYDYYDDRGISSRNNNNGPSVFATTASAFQHGNKKVGITLLTAGAAVSMLGVSLFFNKALLRIGNLLLLAGVPLTLGPTRTAAYFLKPQKARATGVLAVGIFFVFIGWPILGIALEIFGLLNLFGNMFPLFFAVAKQMPIVKSLFQSSGTSGQRKRTKNYDDRYDDPYEERYGGEPRRGGDERYY
jgi:hypothetical protein